MKKLRELPYELADKLELPEDVLLGSAKLTVTGGRSAVIENHRGVLEYTAERIRRLPCRAAKSALTARGCA